MEAGSRFLGKGGQVALEDFATAATLLLADVASVRVSSNQKTEEEQSEITVTAVVESVRLVPVGERSRILVCQWSNIANLLVAISSKKSKEQHE